MTRDLLAGDEKLGPSLLVPSYICVRAGFRAFFRFSEASVVPKEVRTLWIKTQSLQSTWGRGRSLGSPS